MRMIRVGGSVLSLFGAVALSGCDSVASMDCSQIAEHAKQISAAQPIQIRTVSNPQETGRSDSDARCTATAELSDGRTTTLYFRAYDDNGNTMVAYQETAFP